jgi:hypothetical protein
MSSLKVQKVVGLRQVLGVDPPDLTVQGGHPGRQQPDQAQGPALLRCERCAAIDRR